MTYSVEEPKEHTGSQAAAGRAHVGQLQPDVPPGIISLQGGQGMLPVAEERNGGSP